MSIVLPSFLPTFLPFSTILTKVLNVKIPKGLNAGDEFIFEISPEDLAQASNVDGSAKRSSGKSYEAMKSPPLLNAEPQLDSILGSNPYRDFGMALLIGMLIGLSIVFGFILGVLHVTEPLGPNGLPMNHNSSEDSNSPTQQLAQRMKSKSTGGGTTTSSSTTASARKVLKSILNGAAGSGEKRRNKNKDKRK